MFAAHWAKGFSAGAGGYEYGLFLGVVCFAIAIRGGDPYSVDAKLSRELQHFGNVARRSGADHVRLVKPHSVVAVGCPL